MAKPEVSLPRALASPWTGLAPTSHRELVAQLRHFNLLAVMTPELLDARGSRLNVTLRDDKEQIHHLRISSTRDPAQREIYSLLGVRDPLGRTMRVAQI